jgi:lysozyme family protein
MRIVTMENDNRTLANLAINRRDLLLASAKFASVAAAAPFAILPAAAQVLKQRSPFDALQERARALGIPLGKSATDKSVLDKTQPVPLSSLVDIVDGALDRSLTGDTEAAKLADDAGALLSEINKSIRQPRTVDADKRVSYKFEDLKADYRKKFDNCTMDPARLPALKSWADRLWDPKYRMRYGNLEKVSGVPWYVIAVIHYRECSANFLGHLHNGDPLKALTVQVPPHRPDPPWPPSPWDPVGAWQTSAIDALKIDNFFDQPKTYWTLERTLFRLESYNGFGTRGHGVIPNYLWNYSSYPTKGGYDSDGHFKPSYVSSQCGTAVFLKLWANENKIAFA